MSVANKIPRRLVLRENHPTYIKFQKLIDFANELGISLEFNGSYAVLIYDEDRDQNLPDLRMEDIEDGMIHSFPYDFEFKIVYDNPEYLLQQKLEREKWAKLQAEEERLAKEKEEARKKELLEQQAKEKENQERALLAELMKKYNA